MKNIKKSRKIKCVEILEKKQRLYLETDGREEDRPTIHYIYTLDLAPFSGFVDKLEQSDDAVAIHLDG